MDVQGYEQRVLQGSERIFSEGKVAAIFTEILFVPLYEDQVYFQNLYADLWRHGFRLVYIYNPVVNELKFLSWCDALFVHPDVMVHRLAVHLRMYRI